jgi:hypothetical protein
VRRQAVDAHRQARRGDGIARQRVYPVSASIACANVWPRFSSARSPLSRSSRATTPALISHERAIAGTSAAPSQASSRGRSRTTAAKYSASASSPCLITSASPAESSRPGSERSVSVSVTTADGWWNAPTRFLPSARIDLREQRGGRLHEANAAHEDGRREPGDVADDAAAQRDDDRTPVSACRDERIDDPFDRGHRLLRLTTTERQHGGRRDAPRRPFDGSGIEGPDISVGDEQHGRRLQRGECFVETSQQAAADRDVVRRGGNVDANSKHGAVF